jgi:VWFA-related protein
MNKLKSFGIILTGFFCLTNVFSQNPKPTPPDDDVVRIETNLIQIDVVVTDKNGNEVTDLRREDFEVYENDELMKVSNFSYTSIKKNDGAMNANLLSANGLENVPPRVGEIRRTVAIVVDDLLLARTSVNYVKKSLTKFINEQVQPNDLVAIIKTSGSIGVLQQFTTDTKKLLNAIENLEWKPLTSVGTSPFPPIEITFSEQIASNIIGGLQETPTDREAQSVTDALKANIENRSNVAAIANNFRNEQLISGTLNVLLKTIEAMNRLGGRKSIVFVVEGLNNITGTEAGSLDSSGQNKFVSFENKELLRKISESANRSAVSIYPLDPRGVQSVALTAEANTRDGFLSSMNGAQIDQKVSVEREKIARSHDALKILAQETGGKAFINANDLDRGFKEMLNSQNGYYLLGYQPDADTFDAGNRKFNKLTVKVKRPNLNVTYRSGFFNVAETPSQNQLQSNNASFVQKLLSPYRYDEVNLSVTSVFAGTQNEVSTLRSFINIKPSDLQFVDSGNGKKTANFELLAIAFDENGVPIARLGGGFSATVKADEYTKLMKSGLACNLSFATKEFGLHQVKVAVRDANSGKIGTISQSVNVPNTKVDEMALSGILLENFTVDQWKALNNNTLKSSFGKMQQDTAARQFKKGTVLTYSYAIYVFPKMKDSKLANLNAQAILWKDGKEVFRGAPEKINLTAKFALQQQNQRGAFILGTEMSAGRYVLQIIVGQEKQTIGFDLVD